MVQAYALAKVQMGREAELRKELAVDEYIKKLSLVLQLYLAHFGLLYRGRTPRY